MDLLHIVPGKSVADIGAGSGWFTVRAARRVTGAGAVVAEDINPDAITYIQNRAKKESLGNIQTVLGTPDDPKLAANSIDSVLLLKVYHEIANPVFFMQHLRGSLKPGARVGDHRPNGQWVGHGPRDTPADSGEGDGRGWVQEGSEVRFHQERWAGLLSDL